MKARILAATMLAAAAMAAADDKKGTAKKEVREEDNTRVVHTPPPPNLPKDAVEVRPGLWRWRDKDGKDWLFRRTPFGLAKYEPEDSADVVDPGGLVARDKGDTVEFEAKSPFGVRRWTKNKTELNDAERAALKRAAESKGNAKGEAKPASGKSKE
jgi:hypothetical protein